EEGAGVCSPAGHGERVGFAPSPQEKEMKEHEKDNLLPLCMEPPVRWRFVGPKRYSTGSGAYGPEPANSDSAPDSGSATESERTATRRNERAAQKTEKAEWQISGLAVYGKGTLLHGGCRTKLTGSSHHSSASEREFFRWLQ